MKFRVCGISPDGRAREGIVASLAAANCLAERARERGHAQVTIEAICA